MKSFRYVAISVIAFIFCSMSIRAQVPAGSQDYQEVEVVEPCSEMDYPSTTEVLRGHGIGEDRNQQFSIEKARVHAINDLASQISTDVDATMKMLDESWDMNETANYASHARNEIESKVKQTTGYTVVCRKTMAYMLQGVRMMKTYMTIEINTDKVLRVAYDALKQDENVPLDQSYEEFRQVFNEQLNNY